MASQIEGDLNITGHLTVGTASLPSASVSNATVASNAAIARSKLAQDALKPYPIRLTDCRVWDAPMTLLPVTPANDDLGVIVGTFGTDGVTIQTGDCKASDTSRYLRFFCAMPAEYDSAQTAIIRVSAAMLTTIADTQATMDCWIYSYDRDGTISADICGHEFYNINSLTWDDYDFDIESTTLTPGLMLDVRLSISIVDSATATAVKGCIGAIELLCDVKG